MGKSAKLIPYLISVAGIAGVVLIIIASTDVIYPGEVAPLGSPDDVGASRTIPSSPATTTRTTTLPESTPEAIPTALPTFTPTSTPLPTPTPMPIAVSPPFVSSAGTLAYVEEGVLAVVRPGAVDVKRVADRVVDNAQAVVWSPDGRRLLYITGMSGPEGSSTSDRRALYVWNSQSGELLDVRRDVPDFPSDVSGIGNMAWSPKGSRILLGSLSNAGAWVLDVETARAWQLSGPSINSAAWIDEDRILCKRVGTTASHLLNVISSTQTLTRALTVTGTYSLSPNRDYVASFTGQPGMGQRLQILPLPGHDPLSVSYQPTITVSESMSPHSPLWSPDGRWLAYGVEGATSRKGTGSHTLVADTGGAKETQNYAGLLPVAWSPDSRLLAGFGCRETTCRLSVVDPISGRVTTLVSASNLDLWDLAWSPRGAYLIYSLSGSDVDTEGLTLWNRATGEQTHVIPTSKMQPLTDLQWTADGCTFYAARREKREGDQLAVSAILGVGPTWRDRWDVAPGFGGDPARPPQALKQRLGSQGIQLCPGPLLNGRRLIAYYGTPLGPGLGILGRYGISETLRLLQQQAQAYRDLDPDTNTIVAFHMVTTIADDFAGADGDYNHHVPPETIQPWIESMEKVGGWSILDVQPGRANLIGELDSIAPFLLEPDVHLAVDPEFIVSEGQVPGQDLGQISGHQINRIQAHMDEVARRIGHRKILVIHQFDDRMIDQKEVILDYPLVDLVWDADGFGGPGAKIGDYNQYRTEAGFEYGGFKIFYRYDEPLVTPQEVLSLDPPPRIVIYQ